VILIVIPSAIQSQKNIFDPSQFQPVCPASDGVYQVLKLTANGLVGTFDLYMVSVHLTFVDLTFDLYMVSVDLTFDLWHLLL
jgi:hypothetical protein